MADHGHKHAGKDHGHAAEESTPGTMDISEHVAMWNAFWDVSKYSAIGIMVLAALLALFRAHNGPY